MAKIYTKGTWQDEILSGDERYNILEDGGGAFKSSMRIELSTSVVQAGTAMDAARMNNIEDGIDAIDTLVSNLIARVGKSLNSDGELNFASATELTISSGAVTITQNLHTIDTESDASSDDLDTINGGADGYMLIVRPQSDARTVVVKHGTGNILCVGNSDYTLDDAHDVVILIYDSTLAKWCALQGGSAKNFTGDSGSGGAAGLVPAPAAGDAAAGKALRADGVWAVPRNQRNYLINGGFDIAQRQVPGTLTAIATDKYSADRWRTSRQTADLQFQRNDATSESGLTSMSYGLFKQITNAGKFMIYQIIEGINSVPLRGKKVTFQAKMKASASKTIRMAIIELQAAGTIDTIPATFVSSWGANTVDPTLGSNLAVVTAAQSKAITTSWASYSVTVTVPATSKNLICAIWTDSQFSALDTLSVAECGLFEGETVMPWIPEPISETLSKCLRYYEKSYALETAPATSTSAGIDFMQVPNTNTTTSVNLEFVIHYLAMKRTACTAVVYDFDTVPNLGKIRAATYGGWSQNVTPGLGPGNFSQRSFSVGHSAIGLYAIQFHWIAEAEL